VIPARLLAFTRAGRLHVAAAGSPPPQHGPERRGPGRRETDREGEVAASRLRTVFMAAPIGIALLDRHGAIAAVNPALCALFGRLPEALLEVPLTALVHGDDAEAVRELLDASVRRPRTTERLEIRCTRADGTVRWGELSVSDTDIAQVAEFNGVFAEVFGEPVGSDRHRESEPAGALAHA
jgi:PAS domain S-box-containing protein